MSFQVAGQSISASLTRILTLFLFWKLLLLLLAASSPGPGYDTSATLLLPELDEQRYPSPPSKASARVLNRLVRWDSLHFIGVAQHGERYEQDRAWGWLYTTILKASAQGSLHNVNDMTKIPAKYLVASHTVPPLPLSYAAPLFGARLSHFFHLLSTLTLFLLTYTVLPGDITWRRSTAFVAACLFIVSPAGIFLSAPYSESVFAFFNFAGILFISQLRPRSGSLPDTCKQTCFTISSGILFAIACMIRGNGLLSVLVYIEPGLALLKELVAGSLRLSVLIKLLGVGIACLITLLGYAFPQILAYSKYCERGVRRPWCDNLIPSIYTFVQERYWNVGFLKYWTLSNLPLFLIALPMLGIMLSTGIACLVGRPIMAKYTPINATDQNELVVQRVPVPNSLRYMALPQVALAILALTNFHVQIINRLSSGYPLWYIILAIAITSAQPEQPQAQDTTISATYLSNTRTQKWLVRGMIMYAMIQGGLFASFLPPA